MAKAVRDFNKTWTSAEIVASLDQLWVLLDAQSSDTGKIEFEGFCNAIFSKLLEATPAEIDRACDGITATALELNQLDGVNVGGQSTNDILTVGTTQVVLNKQIFTPKINSVNTTTVSSEMLNTLIGVNDEGKVLTVRQGFNVGNATITANFVTTDNHGLTNVDLGTTVGTLYLAGSQDFNMSEILVVNNLSTTDELKIETILLDKLWHNGSEYSSMTVHPNHSVTFMVIPEGFNVLSFSRGTLNV